MLIYRTPELATPTNSVLAIDHANKRRLACRSPGSDPVLVIEAFVKNPNITEYDSTDWWRVDEAPIQPREIYMPEVRNRLGKPGAYCSVVSVSDLREFAASKGMVWCSRERSDYTLPAQAAA